MTAGEAASEEDAAPLADVPAGRPALGVVKGIVSGIADHHCLKSVDAMVVGIELNLGVFVAGAYAALWEKGV